MEAPWHTVEFAVSDGIRTPTGAASRSAPSCAVCDHSLPSTAIIRQQLFAAEQTKQPRRTGQPQPTRLGKEDSWHQCPAQDCPVKERLQDNRCKGCWTEFLHDVKIVIAIIITIFISFLIVIFICTTVVHFTSPRRLGATL